MHTSTYPEFIALQEKDDQYVNMMLITLWDMNLMFNVPVNQ